MRQAPVRDADRQAIEQLLQHEVAVFGYRGVDITPEADHDGDPILRVHVHYGDGEPVDLSVLTDILSKMRNLLWDRHEERFPIIQHHFPETAVIRKRTQ